MHLNARAACLRPLRSPASLAVAAAFAAWPGAGASGELVQAGDAYEAWRRSPWFQRAWSEDQWRLEVEQAAPVLGPALGASAWWNDSMGAVLSARIVDGASEAGPRALLADACAAWRIARTEQGAIDVLGGARMAAASDEVGAAGGVDLGAYRGESQPIVGLRARHELLPGVVAAARADVSPRADATPAGWSVGGGLHVELDRAWRLSVEASVGSLDRTLSDTLGAASPGDGRSEGAIWIGLSRSF